MKTLFKASCLRREYDENNTCLYQTWIGKTTSPEWVYYHLELIKILKNYNIDRILVDSTKQAAVCKKDGDWAVKIVTPQLIDNGLRYVAIVLPQEMFARLPIHGYIEQVKDELTIKYFEKKGDAKEWIIAI